MDDLAAEPRGPGQVEGEIEHVLLVLARLLQQIVPFGFDDDVAGRAGERAFARAFDVDVVAMGDFEHREPERRLDLAPGSVALDEDHLRHQADSPRRGARPRRRRRSSARIAAASAGPSGRTAAPAQPRGDDAEPPTPAQLSRRPPASARAVPRRSASCRATTITAWVTGRASARSARSRAPANSSSHSLQRRHRGREPANPAQTPRDRPAPTALPPTAIATSQLGAAGIDADRRARRARIGRAAVRLLDLKQLHGSDRSI